MAAASTSCLAVSGSDSEPERSITGIWPVWLFVVGIFALWRLEEREADDVTGWGLSDTRAREFDIRRGT